jgi:hypothetical protein
MLSRYTFVQETVWLANGVAVDDREIRSAGNGRRINRIVFCELWSRFR